MIAATLYDEWGDILSVDDERLQDTSGDAEFLVWEYAEGYFWEEYSLTPLTVRYSTGKSYKVSCVPKNSQDWDIEAKEMITVAIRNERGALLSVENERSKDTPEDAGYLIDKYVKNYSWKGSFMTVNYSTGKAYQVQWVESEMVQISGAKESSK